jgi:hypothetical protein
MVRGYDQSLERENEADYAHLMIPMYFDPMRYPASADGGTLGEAYEGNDIDPIVITSGLPFLI